MSERTSVGCGTLVRVTPWHALLDVVEDPTGTWRLVDDQQREYGRVEIRRVMNGTDTRYRASFRGEVIGWATTLKDAVERVHAAFIRSHGPQGGAIASWGPVS